MKWPYYSTDLTNPQRPNRIVSPQTCPPCGLWHWCGAPARMSFWGTWGAGAPVMATCTALLAGCCLSGTPSAMNTTAALAATPTKVFITTELSEAVIPVLGFNSQQRYLAIYHPLNDVVNIGYNNMVFL